MLHENKMRIGNALEGESYVGKTTTLETMREIKEIREKGIIIVPEYSVIGTLPKFPRDAVDDVKKAVQIMIDLEKRRTDFLMRGLAESKDAMVLFDRGPVTCIAFEHAAEKAGFNGSSLWLAEAFQREIEDKNVLIPNGMIHLTAKRGIIQQREKRRVKDGGMEVMDFLRDEDVIKSLNEAFAAFENFLPTQLFLTLETSNKRSDEICAEVLQFIGGQDDAVPDNIPDFLSFARSLL